MRSKGMKKILLSVCICSLLLGTTGCYNQTSTSENTADPEAAAEAEKVDYNEDETSNLGPWTRAMGSVLIYLNDGDPYYFGGYQITENNKTAAINILSSSWNINSRFDLLTQINLLLTEGDRMEYLKEAKEMNAMSQKDLKVAMKQLSGDLLIHYQMVKYNWKTWKKKGLLAWDMCRISHLVQWGYVADYLSREEAQALIEPAAKKLKKNFTSWNEVQNNWLDGYCLFASVDRDAANTDYTNRKALYETLLEEQPEDKPLYDDTLFTQEIIPVSVVSYQTILEELNVEEEAASKKADKDKKNANKASENVTSEPTASE